MDKIKKLAFFLKIARESDEVYTYLINKIINLFKENSIDISSDNYIKKYKIDLRDLHFYDYTILDITAAGDFLYLEIYHPSKDTRSEQDKFFKGLYTTPSTISFYPNEDEWELLNKDGNPLKSLIARDSVLISHEITHFLNNTRISNPKNRRAISKYERQNTGGESFGYINSTEEVQARIMAIIFFITNELIEKDQGKNLYEFYRQKWLPIYENNSGTKVEKFLARMLNYVVKNDLNSFVNDIFDVSHTLYIGNDLLLEETKKRYLKRLYDLFITLKNKLENKKKSDYEDLPDYFEL